MVQNFPGPYELRVEYTTKIGGTPLIHTQRLNVDLTAVPTPGDDFTNINLKTRGGILTPDLATGVENWLGLIDARFNISTDFGIVELWAYVPLTFDATFISAYSPTIVAGTDAVNSTIVAAQEVYTFRTVEGGVMRLTWIETTSLPTQPESFPTGTASINAIEQFIIGASNWVLARDTSYPFASMRFLGGQNEKTFRQRFR